MASDDDTAQSRPREPLSIPWIVVGAMIGVGIGIALDDVAVGIGIGVAIGISLGLAAGGGSGRFGCHRRRPR